MGFNFPLSYEEEQSVLREIMSEDKIEGRANKRKRGQEIHAACSRRERTGQREMGEQKRVLLSKQEQERKCKGKGESRGISTKEGGEMQGIPPDK